MPSLDIVKQNVAAHWGKRAAHFDEDFGHSIRTDDERAAWDRVFALAVGGDPTGWHPVRQSYADGFADLIETTALLFMTKMMEQSDLIGVVASDVALYYQEHGLVGRP